jgi:hypothetical protein
MATNKMNRKCDQADCFVSVVLIRWDTEENQQLDQRSVHGEDPENIDFGGHRYRQVLIFIE